MRLKSSTADLSAGDLADLRRAPIVRRFAPRNATKAELLVCRHAGRTIALKDYGARPFVVRQLLGRALIRREARAYRSAGGLPGLPRFLGRLGPFALATEWIEARPLAELVPGEVPPQCFERLDATLRALHGRGIAHGDLHHRDVLVDGAGAVWIVDLASAWIAGPRAGGWRWRVFELLRDQDRVALARLRARFTGQDEREAIAAVGPGAARRHALARRVRRALDGLRGR